MSNLRNIPAVDEVLAQDEIIKLLEVYNRNFVVSNIRLALDSLRKELRNSEQVLDKNVITEKSIEITNKLVKHKTLGSLQKVINATGVVLHTNLGRAPLSNNTVKHLSDLVSGYTNLEMDLETGERGSRYSHVEELLIELTGAEAGLVVNNNAAAVLLGLNTLAQGKEVVVSRGQLVEVGGAFRIPDVMKQSGAKLVEVGTTNKTYIADFEKAITEDTAVLFSAHTSNYKIIGFSEEVKLEELVKLGQKANVIVMQDLGSGILFKLDKWGLTEEPTVEECVNSGADIITFSGDKLLGGPQAGIIVGKKQYIDLMKKNQLTRALRVDKLTIATLEATLMEYLKTNPKDNIPVIKMLTFDINDLRLKAEVLGTKLETCLNKNKQVKNIDIIKIEDMVGGGAYPTYKLDGWGVEIEFQGITLETISKRLRIMNPSVITRKQDGKLLISVRTLFDNEQDILIDSIVTALED